MLWSIKRKISIFRKKKAFTLVELIIVILILSILATIGIVSFNNYGRDARDSKRSADLRTLNFSIEEKSVLWVWIMSIIHPIQANRVSSPDFWWKTLINWGDYEAWKINPTALDIKESNFLDPKWESYRIGWLIQSNKVRYELASTLESSGTKTAHVIWNFSPRNSIINGYCTIWKPIFTIWLQTDFYRFYPWDIVNIWVQVWLKVESVSLNWW
jgi:prepilin-type N-terminal cleavage/methylation domain-containing protein